jgi:ubiquinone/menaquinone biosynthesis C-methylase UbiE
VNVAALTYALSPSHYEIALISWREKRIVNHLLKQITNGNHTLLDIPSGYGRFTPLFRQHGFKVINGDLNLYALLYQRQRFPDSNLMFVTDGNCLPLPDNSALSFLISDFFNISNHDQRIALLRELARVTNCYLIVSVYLESNFHRLAQLVSRRKRRMTMISRTQWDTELRSCGLKILRISRPLRFLHAQNIFLLEKSPIIEK